MNFLKNQKVATDLKVTLSKATTPEVQTDTKLFLMTTIENDFLIVNA